MDLDNDDNFGTGGSKLTVPGESLTSSQTYMRSVRHASTSRIGLADFADVCNRGHGTYVEDEEVIASVAGTIERVNKLITVRAVRTR
jgi:exosome complex component RRP4